MLGLRASDTIAPVPWSITAVAPSVVDSTSPPRFRIDGTAAAVANTLAVPLRAPSETLKITVRAPAPAPVARKSTASTTALAAAVAAPALVKVTTSGAPDTPPDRVPIGLPNQSTVEPDTAIPPRLSRPSWSPAVALPAIETVRVPPEKPVAGRAASRTDADTPWSRRTAAVPIVASRLSPLRSKKIGPVGGGGGDGGLLDKLAPALVAAPEVELVVAAPGAGCDVPAVLPSPAGVGLAARWAVISASSERPVNCWTVAAPTVPPAARAGATAAIAVANTVCALAILAKAATVLAPPTAVSICAVNAAPMLASDAPLAWIDAVSAGLEKLAAARDIAPANTVGLAKSSAGGVAAAPVPICATTALSAAAAAAEGATWPPCMAVETTLRRLTSLAAAACAWIAVASAALEPAFVASLAAAIGSNRVSASVVGRPRAWSTRWTATSGAAPLVIIAWTSVVSGSTTVAPTGADSGCVNVMPVDRSVPPRNTSGPVGWSVSVKLPVESLITTGSPT